MILSTPLDFSRSAESFDLPRNLFTEDQNSVSFEDQWTRVDSKHATRDPGGEEADPRGKCFQTKKSQERFPRKEKTSPSCLLSVRERRSGGYPFPSLLVDLVIRCSPPIPIAYPVPNVPRLLNVPVGKMFVAGLRELLVFCLSHLSFVCDLSSSIASPSSSVSRSRSIRDTYDEREKLIAAYHIISKTQCLLEMRSGDGLVHASPLADLEQSEESKSLSC